MRFELISDNTDVLVGMRLAGIVGTMVKTPQEALNALKNAVQKNDVAIVLITPNVTEMCKDEVFKLKNNSNSKGPIIVEIPDGKSPGRAQDSITRYIREAIGLKI